MVFTLKKLKTLRVRKKKKLIDPKYRQENIRKRLPRRKEREKEEK